MKSRAWILVSAALVLAAFESGFLIYQRTVQEQILERMTAPGAISGAVIVTREPVDAGLFSRTDRLTVRLGSSLYGDADDAPLSLQMDVVASYGLLGLSGEIVPLANTRAVTDLLDMLQGDRPDLDIRYSVDAVGKSITIEAVVSPFDVKFVDESPLMRTAWRASAESPIRWKLHVLQMGPGESVLTADHARIALDDGTGGKLVGTSEGFTLKHEFRRNGNLQEGSAWFVERVTSSSKKQSLAVTDHRGAMEVAFHNLSTEAHRRRAGEGTLDGDYGIDAKRFSLMLKPEGQETASVEGEKLKLRSHGDNVPLALFQPMDEVDFEQLLKKTESVRLRLDEFSFRTDGLPALVKGHLIAHWGHHDERREACLEFPGEGFNMGWSLEMELPDVMLDAVRALAEGRIRGFDPTDFMVAEELHGAPYHVLDFRGDLKRGAQLNGLPTGF